MQNFLRAKHWTRWALAGTLAMGALVSNPLMAQNRPDAQPAPAASSQEIGETQQQFLRLLRSSPTLTTVVSHDPTLLSDQAYVSRNNPELARFLTLHPEVAQNSDFYLFSKVGPGNRQQALAREVWPELVPVQRNNGQLRELVAEMQPIVILPALFFAVVWMTKLFVEGRRWSRTFKMQCEIHSRLIEKFGSNQELVAYMETDAGRRFLEASPIQTSSGQNTPVPSVLGRILTPVQIGVVLSMLGAGMLSIRHAAIDTDVPMLVLGTLLLMPGLGFILSAGITWFLAHKLGLMPEKSSSGALALHNND